MTKAGQEIIQGAQDALDYLRGEKTKGRAHYIIAAEIDVKSIREKTGLTQERFAETYGFSLSTLKKWESGNRQPEGPAKAYLMVINERPNVVKKALEGATAA
jgi:putative transcriptional regulator